MAVSATDTIINQLIRNHLVNGKLVPGKEVAVSVDRAEGTTQRCRPQMLDSAS
jgi:hypothetical protein